MDESARDLIPPPRIVRERLAQNYEEADLLRRLLKLAIVAAEKPQDRKSRPDRKGATQ
jgi:hypothetical protein